MSHSQNGSVFLEKQARKHVQNCAERRQNEVELDLNEREGHSEGESTWDSA
jgi:hypothetical protein